MGVINRGGIVLKKGQQYRINGEINLSRCFGDPKFKKDNWMSSTPDIYSFPATACKRWILATDGFINAAKLNERLQWKDSK
jgi:serine/threonine protein phosphatase PrpC